MMNIIGQEQTLAELSKICEIFKCSEQEIKPHFILAGASGSGKTLLIQSLAEAFEFGFLEVNAAQLTKEGTSGNSLSKALAPLKVGAIEQLKDQDNGHFVVRKRKEV